MSIRSRMSDVWQNHTDIALDQIRIHGQKGKSGTDKKETEREREREAKRKKWKDRSKLPLIESLMYYSALRVFRGHCTYPPPILLSIKRHSLCPCTSCDLRSIGRTMVTWDRFSINQSNEPNCVLFWLSEWVISIFKTNST